MSEIASRVKAIIVDKLGVEESEVTNEASFTNDLGADSLDIIDTSSTSAPAKLMFDGHTIKFFTAVVLQASSIVASFTNTSYVDNSTSLSTPSPLVAFPCGSASINNTFLPFFAIIVLKLTVVVVFPTPPFWFATDIILHIFLPPILVNFFFSLIYL